MINAPEYAARRAKLLSKIEDGSIVLLFSGEAKKSSADDTYPFEVNRNFYYLTGIEQESSALMLVKSYGETKEYLFISAYDPNKEKWYGRKLTVEEAREKSGINNVLLKNALTARIDGALNDQIRTYGPISRVYLDLEEEQKLGRGIAAADYRNSLEATYDGVHVFDCYPLIIRQRMVKSKAEVDELRKAIKTTSLGIQAVMAMARPGLHEYELANRFFQVINDDNANQGLSFNTIMASGKNATILHYPNPQSVVGEGELILMDLGARSNYYCGDISRVVPANGKFNEEQKTIYQIVLGCNKAVANFARPGVTIAELQSFTKEYLASECLSHGFIKEKSEIDKYYFHGVSHHIGLDTHDPSDRSLPLEPGNVISDEPGLYMADRGIGVRIEDDLLIIEKGSEVLSSDIIKEIADIESFYKSGHLK
ncbi:MAG: aminopeptidase P N-terminal domain-containing protein [Bacillota bacterium]|nr:aminopeptidase P N-terminal domain-containing protein [Bacillota bacterium]